MNNIHDRYNEIVLLEILRKVSFLHVLRHYSWHFEQLEKNMKKDNGKCLGEVDNVILVMLIATEVYH